MVVNKTSVADSTTPGVDDMLPTRQLVLGMAHRDGSIIGSELYAAANACGLSVDQVRSCARRLIAEGLFTRTGEGKDAIFHATEAGQATLQSSLQRHLLGYHQDAQGRGWDRRWRLVAFAIPEPYRAARDSFRDTLRSLGAAAIHNGLYVSPHAFHSEVNAAADRLDVREYVMTSTTDDLVIGGCDDPRKLATSLWPLAEVARRYEHFTESYAHVPAQLERMQREGQKLSESDFIPGALRIAIRFGECFDVDPLLPPELLPKPWPGKAARQVLARCRKLGMLARGEKSSPALFSVFDDVVALLP